MTRRHPLSPPERIAAAVLTGPAGHLYAGLADWAVLLARFAWARTRGSVAAQARRYRRRARAPR